MGSSWGRGSQVDSAPSTEPDVGLDHTALRSWPDPKLRVGHSTDGAAQAPPICGISAIRTLSSGSNPRGPCALSLRNSSSGLALVSSTWGALVRCRAPWTCSEAQALPSPSHLKHPCPFFSQEDSEKVRDVLCYLWQQRVYYLFSFFLSWLILSRLRSHLAYSIFSLSNILESWDVE